jgi:hypothetical protein
VAVEAVDSPIPRAKARSKARRKDKADKDKEHKDKEHKARTLRVVPTDKAVPQGHQPPTSHRAPFKAV